MKVIGSIVLWLAVAFGVTCAVSFCVMMGVAGIHDWWNFVPTMGFWHAFNITIWFSVPLSVYGSYRTSSGD